MLDQMVNLIVEVVVTNTLSESTKSKGAKELGKALVAGHIFCLETLSGIHPKTLAKCLNGSGPGLCHGGIMVAKFTNLDKKHGILNVLGYHYNTVMGQVIHNVISSFERMQENSIPENKSFMLASMTSSNVFNVMETFHRLLMEYDLMELESENGF